jgi:uncharacterized membrane protein YhdT
MTILLLVLFFYVLSIYGSVRFLRRAYYHKKGMWYNKVPSNFDLFILIIPIVNTVLGVNFILGYWKDIEYRNDKELLIEKIIKPRRR